MTFRVWLDEATNTATVEELDSFGGELGGAALVVVILIGLFVAPAFLPFYLLCRRCKKIDSFSQREFRRAVGNLIICLCFALIRLSFRFVYEGLEGPILFALMWLYSTTPLAALVTALWSLVVSGKALRLAKKLSLGKPDVTNCRKAIAVNVIIPILVRIYTLF